MDALIIVMRIVHIFSGVFWAGAIFFIVLFLQPALMGAGPAGGQVMQRLVAARVLTIVPVFALLTVLSGLWLIWRVSGGGSAEWMGSRHGIALSIGGASAILGFALGLGVMRPATLGAMAIGQAAQAAGGPPTPEQQAQMQALQKRARSSAVGVAHLLAIAVIAMAVARYL